MNKISDGLWNVICMSMKEHWKMDCNEEVRKELEKRAEIQLFNGGAFIALENEFDLFVLPEKQGKWNIRGELTNYIQKMTDKYGTIVVRVGENNCRALRLANKFGFKKVSVEDGIVRLERTP
jgi:hypothetical protein